MDFNPCDALFGRSPLLICDLATLNDWEQVTHGDPINVDMSRMVNR